MAPVTEPRWTGEHVVSEANGQRSREEGTLASGKLPAGAVLALDADDNYVQLAPGASDTTNQAVAILYGPTNASAGASPCVIHRRDCEVSDECLTWPDGITEEQLATATEQLAGAGIIVR